MVPSVTVHFSSTRRFKCFQVTATFPGDRLTLTQTTDDEAWPFLSSSAHGTFPPKHFAIEIDDDPLSEKIK